MQNKRTLFLIEVAIFAALALVLNILPFLSFRVWAQGGSISFAMIPVFIVAYRWGLKGGLLTGFLYAILQIIAGIAYNIHPVQFILDYPVAFTVLGFSGLFYTQARAALKRDNTKHFVGFVIAGVTLGIFLRFLSHYFAGVVFFGSSIEGMNAWVFSLLYNGSYLLPSLIINIIAVSFLFSKRPSLVTK